MLPTKKRPIFFYIFKTLCLVILTNKKKTNSLILITLDFFERVKGKFSRICPATSFRFECVSNSAHTHSALSSYHSVKRYPIHRMLGGIARRDSTIKIIEALHVPSETVALSSVWPRIVACNRAMRPNAASASRYPQHRGDRLRVLSTLRPLRRCRSI